MHSLEINQQYFDLIVRTVRGLSPVPEFNTVTPDRTEIAKKFIKKLRKKYAFKLNNNFLINTAMLMGPSFLTKAWAKMAPNALTMCGEKNIELLISALRDVEEKNIEGDFIETGVWRGGVPIIMRAFLQAANNKKRKVWIADSFQGLPDDSAEKSDQAAHILLEPLGHLSVSRKDVEKALNYFQLNDDQIVFLEGWFDQTLKTIPKENKFSIIRLDGDYYESTKVAIEELYPRLNSGGYVIVDDYNLPIGCKKAIDEYRENHGIDEEIIKINKQSIYWIKK